MKILWQIMRDIGLLILRAFPGIFLATHGLGKIFSGRMPQFIEGVAAMGFPAPTLFGWAAALTELVGGLLVAAGLYTRVSSFFIFITMGVAAFIRHGADPFAKKELALLYWVVALALMLTGPGRYSIDRFLGRERDV